MVVSIAITDNEDQVELNVRVFIDPGVQESITECIRDSDGQQVNPYLCPIDLRPDSITRTCNDVPCPPRWNISDFSPCTKTCGGGVQTREVHCIHEVARGGGNTLPVTADLCPQPPPRAQQFCNMIDCPIEWKVAEWSKVRYVHSFLLFILITICVRSMNQHTLERILIRESVSESQPVNLDQNP